MTGLLSLHPESTNKSKGATRHESGFTLVELAVALLIVGLLLASTLMPLSTQLEVRNTADTRRALEQIREAIIGFAQMNGRLPCPASGAVSAGTAGAGVEQYNGATCTTLIGVVPWSTLGVSETDLWGRRITYRVSTVFADATAQNTWHTTAPGDQSVSINCTAPSPTPTITFGLCSLGEIAVMTRSIDPATSVHSTSAVGTGLAAALVSHGRNGYGAWQSNGIQLSGVTVGTDEYANTTTGQPASTGSPGSGNNYTSYLFYSRDATPSAAACSETATASPFCEYDDIVSMITANALVARMVSAGKLP